MDSNIVVAAATVILVCITGYYAYLTHRLAAESKRANDFQRQAFETQFRAAIYPQLFCSAETRAGATTLTIHNPGENSAFDLDIIAVTVIDSKDVPVEEFIEEYVQESFRDREKNAGVADRLMDESFYGVFDHFVYPVFPPRRKVAVRLERSLLVDSIHLLLQFRDSYGANYAHYYWLISAGGPNERFAIGCLAPTAPAVSPRIRYDGSKDPMELKAENGHLPADFSEIAQLFRASFSSGVTAAGRAGVEDPGDWSAL